MIRNVVINKVLSSFFILLVFAGRGLFGQEIITEKDLKHRIEAARSSTDFASVINEHFSRGVTPENNAFAALQFVFGSDREGKPESDEFYRLLGIEGPAAEGPWFEPITKDASSEERDKIFAEERIASGRPWNEDECPAVAEWLKQNEAAMKTVAEAVKKDGWFYPVVLRKSVDQSSGDLITGIQPHVHAHRDLANCFRCRVYLRLAQGQIDEAWNDVMTIHRLGRLISRGPSVVDYLVGSAIDGIACHLASRVMNTSSFTDEQLKRYQAEWLSLPRLAGLHDAIHFTERMTLIDFARAIESGQCSPEDLLDLEFDSDDLFVKLVERQDWPQVYVVIQEAFDELSSAFLADIHERANRMKTFQTHWEEDQPGERSKRVAALLLQREHTAETRKQLARLTVSSMLISYSKTEVSDRRSLQTHQNIQIQFALRRYFLAHQKYPDGLQQLVPDFIEMIPPDLFGGEPLRYQLSPTEAILYSIGPNLVDDNGKESVPQSDDSTWQTVGDIVIRLPLTPK